MNEGGLSDRRFSDKGLRESLGKKFERTFREVSSEGSFRESLYFRGLREVSLGTKSSSERSLR